MSKTRKEAKEPMKYTREEIVRMCEKAMKEDVRTFYMKTFVNYRGKVKGNMELYYTELVAEFVLNHIDEFMDIKPINKAARAKAYNMHHDGTYDPTTNRIEEKTAIEMFLQSRKGRDMKYVGNIIDYQIPLKSRMNDKAGKIDLLSVSDKGVYALELKREDSKDTMLKCVLEAYTNLKLIDKPKLYLDFNIPSDRPLYAVPLVFKGSAQWKEMQEKDDHQHLLKLMKKLDIKGPFYVTTETKYYAEM